MGCRRDVLGGGGEMEPEQLTGALEFADRALAHYETEGVRSEPDRIARVDLVDAAYHLELAVDELIHDAELWSGLRRVDEWPERFEPEQLDRLRVALGADLGTILGGLGYRPPPGLLEFRDELRSQLDRVLTSGGSGQPVVKRAEASLVYLRYRLRDVLLRANGYPQARASTYELRRVVRTAAAVVTRISPAVLPVGVTVGVREAGETVAGLVGVLVARCGLPDLVGRVEQLADADARDWPDQLCRDITRVHAALSRAAVGADTSDEAMDLALSNLKTAHARGRELADQADQLAGLEQPDRLDDLVHALLDQVTAAHQSDTRAEALAQSARQAEQLLDTLAAWHRRRYRP